MNRRGQRRTWRWWGRQARRRGREPARTTRFERLSERILLCGDGNLADALPIAPTGVQVERLDAADDAALFSVTLTEPGRLTIETRTEADLTLQTRTSLLTTGDQLLATSDGQSADVPDDRIVEHLLAGTYLVRVEERGGSSGDFALVTQFDPANPPSEPLTVNFDHDYPYGVTPSTSALGDFNGDGHLDIATPNTYTNDVSVLLGLGDGSFQAAVGSSAGSVVGPYGVASGDFNSDQIADLVTTNLFSNDISVLLGNGDGTFAALPPIPVGTYPLAVVAADWNADGRPDLAVANGRDNDISLLWGQGGGAFELAGRIGVGTLPSYLAAGDFDGDGRPDLIVSNFNSSDLSLLRGLPGGRLAAELRLSSAEHPSVLAAADFNRDGRLDFAVANTGDNSISIHWGRGDGTFDNQVQGAAGSAPIGLAVGDYNRDGLLDLAASNRHQTGVSVLLARPDGTFQAQTQYRAGIQPWYALAGDFNEDGFLDLTTANARSHDVSILLGLGDGTFQQEPTGLRQGESNPQGMVTRDFNGDGVLDLAVTSYTAGDLFVYLGRGDGTFQERLRFDVGSTPVEMLTADFNRDGRDDLASINCDSGDLSVLLGRGDGTFTDEVRYGSSVSGEFGVADDFNGDGFVDFIASGQFATGIAFIPGRGDGTFGERVFFADDEAPADGVAGDFNHDGRLDLATTNLFSPDHDVSVHLGKGNGLFQPPQHYPVGDSPLGIVAADFDQDGNLDLVVANSHSQSVSLLAGHADGTFAPEVRFEVGHLPDFLLARDFDNDGRLDLVVSMAGTPNVAVLKGGGDGSFSPPVRFVVGDGPTPRRGLDAGDFNGDGRLDLALPQVLSNDVAVLLGDELAGFKQPLRFPVGLGPVAMVTGDFSGDGRLDVASVNPTTSELTIALGGGDTTIAGTRRIPVGAAPVAAVTGDFNRDGRLDLATANHGSSDVSLLLGTGTGGFQEQPRLQVGANPVALASGDFNGDGRLDLAAANATSNDVSILLSRGDGTFGDEQRVAAGELPQALSVGDFNRDGKLDLAAANYRGGNVSLLLGRGDGTFQPPLSLSVGRGPVALLAEDFNADGLLDLAAANFLSDDVSLLLGTGNGSFSPLRFAVGASPISLSSGDFDGDGRLDLGVANSRSDDLTLLLGRAGGTFGNPITRAVGDYPVALATADFNGDARADLVVATQFQEETAILQGLGDATFAAGGTISNRRRATPTAADYNGDGLADVALLDLQGRILLRTARAGAAGQFDAPRTINPGQQLAARDFAVVSTDGGSVLAALDVLGSGISFYTRQPGGAFTRQAGPRLPGKLPALIRAADLNGDGRHDLAIAAPGSNQVFIYIQSAAATVVDGFGRGEPDFTLDTAQSPSALELADVDGDARLDILVASRSAGQVSVFYNRADEPFSCEARFATSAGLSSLIEQEGGQALQSSAAPAGMVAGQFGADRLLNLAVANAGTNSMVLLPGTGIGGFLNPSQARTLATGQKPAAVVTGLFNSDALLDVAVLNEGTADLAIFLGQSDSGLLPVTVRPPAGNVPTGLAALDVNGDGRQDLLIGNDFGDLLVLLGNGDGSFQPYQRADGQVALAVADVNGDGREDFIFASHADDAVEVQYSAEGDAFRQFRGDGLLAPTAVTTTDLDRDGVNDLVIANSGANNVLVYLGTGAGEFGPPQRFFAGTRPVGATTCDLNQDGLADVVVANEGSNDVTILLGQITGGQWTLASGPRLTAGLGPVQTLVRDETADGVPDILVTNAQSNDVFLLAGLGLGFFDDRNPLVRATGEQPGPLLPFGDGLVTVNQGSNDITFFPSFLTSPGFDFASGGVRPVAGLVGNFNGDQFTDLLIAHQGDGVIRLLAGGPEGFSLSEPFTHPELPHPAAIASVIRGRDIDVYGVNERGNKAVLITALTGALPTPPALPSLQIGALLFVVAPGVELALGGFNPTLLLKTARSPLGLQAADRSDLGAAPRVSEGAGDAAGEQPQDGQQPSDDDQTKDDEHRAHDAAIAELLSGADDALSQRPPKLPPDGVGLLAEPQPTPESDGAWLPWRLREWAAEWKPQSLLEWLPLPRGVAPVLVGLAAAAREWCSDWTVCTAADAAAVPEEPAGSQTVADRASDDDGWPLDPRAAAILALCLLWESQPAACEPSFRPKIRR